MSFESLGQPLRPTREEAAKYIATELARAVPEGWKVDTLPARGRSLGPTHPMSWRIARTRIPKGEWPTQDYGVRLPGSLEFVVFTHGNNDKGPLSLGVCLEHATLVDTWTLERYGMRACLERIMSDFKPNEWGYT